MVSVFKGHAAVLESVESVDGWHHWSVGAAPPVGVQSLSCAGASTCTLLGSGRITAGQLIGKPLRYVTTDSGRSWVGQGQCADSRLDRGLEHGVVPDCGPLRGGWIWPRRVH
jgi:hypothetical protein